MTNWPESWLREIEAKKGKRPRVDRVECKTGTFTLSVEHKKKGRFPVSEKSVRTVDDIVFDSKKEASRYMQLKLLEKTGDISGLTLQPSWNVEINGKHYCRYSADFSYVCKARGLVIEDIKTDGTQKDAAYRLRKKAAELSHGIRVTEVLA